MFFMRSMQCVFLVGLTLVMSLFIANAEADVVVVGGVDGRTWKSGGGDLPAVVIRNANTIEKTNSPGGVIDFSPENRINWIAPQRADTTRNIAIGLNSPLRGGAINSPNSVGIQITCLT